MANQRRPRGTGSIYQRASDGMWCVTVELDKAADGKRRRKVIVRAKRSDAVRALREASKSSAAGTLRVGVPTLNDWAKVWWSDYAPEEIKVTRWSGYRTEINRYILPRLGRMRLDKIGADAITDWHRWLTSPAPDGLGLSKRTAQGAHSTLSSLLQFAVVREKISRNPARVHKAPKSAKKSRAYMTSTEARSVLDAHTPDDGTVPQTLAMLATSLWIGPRPSELLGLTRDCIDLETGAIEISWQAQTLTAEHGCGESGEDDTYPCGKQRAAYCPKKVVQIPEHTEARHLDGMTYLVRPKTSTSWRAFTMPEPLRLTLQIFLAANPPGIEGLIFHRSTGGMGKGKDGRPISLSEWDKRWKTALAAVDIEGPTPHSARKTCNTILRDLGVPADVRKLILGHASEDVNEKVYTHTSDARVNAAMSAIGRELGTSRPSDDRAPSDAGPGSLRP